ncbi:cytidine deaminase-like protein [Collybia nuda]|uniref:Deoxycytidylate deaminase n=1 Tax=Collybia nuda TaxID=64659 RepID=A0A9P5YIW5_9AGAR|nr:cytidine deaminase-like protein [Collybia nuda]
MLIAIVGTRFSGKSTVENYFVSEKGFKCIQILQNDESFDRGISNHPIPTETVAHSGLINSSIPGGESIIPSFSSRNIPLVKQTQEALQFRSAQELLKYVTINWRLNFVTTDLRTRQSIELFIKRPFFMLLSLDGPLHQRFLRSKSLSISLFVQEDDTIVFGNTSVTDENLSSLRSLSDMVNVHIVNSFPEISLLYTHIDKLDLLNPENLRPGWDAYFMTLASLASHRSNCMKRRVGAVLVRENRVLATGYNGTPRGLANCNDGGCPHCNGDTSSFDIPYECVCLHAEENALLEAGRERIGKGAVLYCNTCPCLRCTVKIIQTGVKAVVYNLGYKVDDASASLFQQAGVELRKFNPNQIFYLPGAY